MISIILCSVIFHEIRSNSDLGQIFAARLSDARHGREIMKELMKEAAEVVMHELERYLAALATIASVSPLLGLQGTVVGVIQVFSVLTTEGSGNAKSLAGGISTALITTAAGLFVAIPALMFHSYFPRRVGDLVITMQQEASKLVEIMHGERELDQRT